MGHGGTSAEILGNGMEVEVKTGNLFTNYLSSFSPLAFFFWKLYLWRMFSNKEWETGRWERHYLNLQAPLKFHSFMKEISKGEHEIFSFVHMRRILFLNIVKQKHENFIQWSCYSCATLISSVLMFFKVTYSFILDVNFYSINCSVLPFANKICCMTVSFVCWQKHM